MVEVLRECYSIPFRELPPLSEDPNFFDSYSLSSIRRVALSQEIDSLLEKQAVELALPSPGYYSPMLLV